MKILVCLKHVPAVEPEIVEGSVREEGLVHEVNEADLYALEAAFEQRGARGATITAVTVGSRRAVDALYVAYARGVDEAIHVDDGAEGCDAVAATTAVAVLARRRGFDLILTGVQASDDQAGEFGIAVAWQLGIPVVTAVVGLDADPDSATARVRREVGNGRLHEIEVRMPCLLTIQTGIHPLRYTPIMALLKARRRAFETIALESLVGGTGPAATIRHAETLGVYKPEASSNCEILPLPAPQAAARLLEELQQEGVI